MWQIVALFNVTVVKMTAALQQAFKKPVWLDF